MRFARISAIVFHHALRESLMYDESIGIVRCQIQKLRLWGDEILPYRSSIADDRFVIRVGVQPGVMPLIFLNPLKS